MIMAFDLQIIFIKGLCYVNTSYHQLAMQLCRLLGNRKKKDQSDSEMQVGQAMANLSQAYTYFLLNDISSSSRSYERYVYHHRCVVCLLLFRRFLVLCCFFKTRK